MSRYFVRALPLFLLLIGFSGIAKADTFQIALTGDLTGTGQFTTDGTCATCSKSNGGLLSFTIEIGSPTGPFDTGANAFDITDDSASSFITYTRATNTLDSPGTTNSETDDFFVITPSGWILLAETPDQGFHGTYTITPVGVPEPSTLVLLLLSGVVGLTVLRLVGRPGLVPSR